VEVRAPPARCGTPFVVTPPFTLPPLGGPVNTVTDIDWDPATQSLWACNVSGAVGNVLVGGAIGPLGTYQAAPGPCGLAPALTGVTVDAGSPTVGMVLVTDGFGVAHLDLGGTLAAPTFALPQPCFPVAGGPAHGIGYSARPVTYGMGGSVGTPPKMGSRGQAVIPSSNLAITVSGATPGALAFLPFGLVPLCPPIFFATVPILHLPQGLYVGQRAERCSDIRDEAPDVGALGAVHD
jgi:hypothetical protein